MNSASFSVSRIETIAWKELKRLSSLGAEINSSLRPKNIAGLESAKYKS